MDKITVENRSRNMSRIRSRNTLPELVVRKLVYNLGYRYRIKGISLPGKPDLVFSKKKKVIFVHGCFWHQHSHAECKIKHMPKSKQDYWMPKLAKNKERDIQNLAKLKELGWDTLYIWECELKNMTEVSQRLKSFLKDSY